MNDIYQTLENLEEDRYHESDIVDFSLKYLKNYLDIGHELALKNYTISQIRGIFEDYEPYFEGEQNGIQNEEQNKMANVSSDTMVHDLNIATLD